MSALCQKRSLAKFPFLIFERKKKDRLAAVSPKSNQVDGCLLFSKVCYVPSESERIDLK
jgi:hypothetical protein